MVALSIMIEGQIGPCEVGITKVSIAHIGITELSIAHANTTFSLSLWLCAGCDFSGHARDCFVMRPPYA